MAHSKIFASFFLLPTFLFSNLSYAQWQAPKIQWQKCLGGTRDEDINSTQLQCIAQTFDGGYIIIGQTESPNGDVCCLHDTGNGDAWLVKLNPDGKIEWQKCFGSEFWNKTWEIGTSVIQTSDKGFAIAGSIISTDGLVPGWHQGYDTSILFDTSYDPHWDAWVAKLDSLGNFEWQKCIGGSKADNASSIVQTSDGGYMVAGLTYSNDGDISGNHGNADVFAVKLSSSGKIQWQKCYGGSSRETINSIIQASDGGFIFAGGTWSNDEGFFNHGLEDAYIVKVDSIGNRQWQTVLGGSAHEEAYSIIQSPDKGYVFTGYTESTNGDVSDHTQITTLFPRDAWVVKLDSAGSKVWEKCFGGSLGDIGTSIVLESDGGFVIGGGTSSYDGDVLQNHQPSSWGAFGDAWIFKLNSSGYLEWQKCLGGTGEDDGFAIIQTKDGGYTLIGETNSDDGDVYGHHLDSVQHHTFDIWVVKLSPAVNAVGSSSLSQSSIQAYPNPASSEVQLKFQMHLMPQKLEFFDALGIKYNLQYHLENNIETIDVHDIPSGAYMTRAVAEGKLQMITFIVRH